MDKQLIVLFHVDIPEIASTLLRNAAITLFKFVMLNEVCFIPLRYMCRNEISKSQVNLLIYFEKLRNFLQSIHSVLHSY